MSTIDAAIIKALVEHVGGDSSGPDSTIAGGKTYTAGDGIDITNDAISVKYDEDTMQLADGKLSVKSGNGGLEMEYIDSATWSKNSHTFLLTNMADIPNMLILKLYSKSENRYHYGIIGIPNLQDPTNGEQHSAIWGPYGNFKTNDIIIKAISGNETAQYGIDIHMMYGSNYEEPSKDKNTGVFKLTGPIGDVLSVLVNYTLFATE